MTDSNSGEGSYMDLFTNQTSTITIAVPLAGPSAVLEGCGKTPGS